MPFSSKTYIPITISTVLLFYIDSPGNKPGKAQILLPPASTGDWTPAEPLCICHDDGGRK